MNPDSYGFHEYDSGYHTAEAADRQALAATLNKLRSQSLGNYASPAERNAYLTALAEIASAHDIRIETTVTYRA